MITPITAGTKIRIVKGCKAREITKGATVEVVSVKPLGAEYGHCVRIVLDVPTKGVVRHVAFYARHANRLADDVLGLNDGNPLHRIVVRRA